MDHWAVTVSRSGDEIVTIEPQVLVGREISAEDADTIRVAAHHLLAFIGDPAPTGHIIVPRDATDDMKAAYGEAVYYTTDTRLLPENIWRAMCDAAPTRNQI